MYLMEFPDDQYAEVLALMASCSWLVLRSAYWTV